MFEPRYYQDAAINQTWSWMQEHEGNPLVVLPTGTGKALLCAMFAKTVVDHNCNVLVLAHVKELVGQNYSEMIEHWPEAPVGMYSAGLGKRDLHKRITIASIQSVFRRADELRKPDLIVVDECHLIPRSSDTMYGAFLAAMKLINPGVKIIGLTATPWRMDSGRLDEGENRIFHGLSYEYSIRQAIDDGFLCPPMSKDTTMHLDTTGVGSRGGEYIPGELMRAVDTRDNNEQAVEEIIAFGRDRKAWLVFCTGTDHSLHVRDLFRAKGITAEALSADTESAERARIIASYKRGWVKVLVSMNLLTTGFNVPMVDLIALLRPTKSVVIYIQTIGRGTRIYPGKQNCLVLDFAQNVQRFGPVDDVKLKEPGEGTGVAPTKVCPDCASILHASVRTCRDCGHVFPDPEIKITATASTAPVISNTEPATWEEVSDVYYSRHEKIGSPPSLKVIYSKGLQSYNEWVCFEHTGFANSKARQWWLDRGGGLPVPKSVNEALSRTKEIRKPTDILVRREGKYWRVTGHREGPLPNLLAASQGDRFYPTARRA